MSKKILQLLTKSRGNISILAITAIMITGFIISALFDFCRIYAARSQTKNTSDSIVLAVAQNLLLFDEKRIMAIAQTLALNNNCRLTELEVTYDEVTVAVEKSLNFILIDKLGYTDCKIVAISKSKVTYPWDNFWGACDTYKFEY